MFMKPTRAIATLGLFCSMVMSTTAVGPSTATSTPQGTTQPGIYSILNNEQVAEKKTNRFFINQDVARTIDSDPIFPYRARPYYSFIGLEHFFTPAFSLGGVITYTHEKDVYSRLQTGEISSNTVADVTGFLPYVNYLLSRTWLLTGQVGVYAESYKDTTVTTTGTIRSRSQVFTPNAEGYVTWIGPNQTWTASVRAGAYYINQRFRSIIDSTGAFSPTRHFESAAVAASARLKYFPDNTFWNAFLHMEADFRIFAGARPGVFKPDSGRQNLLYQIGPGVHFKLNDTWEVRVLALHTVGFGYGKEERIGIRLRAAF